MLCVFFFFSESLFVGILSRCSNLPGKGKALALARRVFVLGKVSGEVLHRHRCFSSWRRSSVVWLLAPMLTLTRPGCQVIDKLFSFCRFKATHRFCMVLWFLFWEPCLWICFFSRFCVEFLPFWEPLWIELQMNQNGFPTLDVPYQRNHCRFNLQPSLCLCQLCQDDLGKNVDDLFVDAGFSEMSRFALSTFGIPSHSFVTRVAARQDHQLARCGFEMIWTCRWKLENILQFPRRFGWFLSGNPQHLTFHELPRSAQQPMSVQMMGLVWSPDRLGKNIERKTR